MNEITPEVDSDSIRYQSKAVHDPKWLADFLADQQTGVLGLIDEETPHLVTQLFVYDEGEGTLYFHGARAGRAHDIVADGGAVRACFTTSEMGRYIPSEQPVNFTVEYASLVAYGPIELVETPVEKRDVLERFMSKFAPHLVPGADYEEIAESSIDRTAVYRLNVETWSGKQGEKPLEYPGAYDLDAIRESQ